MSKTTVPKDLSKSVVAVNLTTDAHHPIPIEFGGSSVTYNYAGKRYLPFIGNDDNLAQLLLEARLISSTQDSCISSIAECTVGEGITVTNIETDHLGEFWSWLDAVNNNQESLDDILLQVADALGCLGNQFVEIVRGAINKKRFIKVYTHSFLRCRLGEINKATGKPDVVIISESFLKKGYISNLTKESVEIPLYDPNRLNKSDNWKREGRIERTMIHLKTPKTGVDFYGVPASISSLRYQVLESKIAQFNLDNFENNMVLGGVLAFKAAMTQEEARKNAREIINAYTGQGKSGRIAVFSSENGIEDMIFKPFDTQKEGSFVDYDKRVEDKIIGANKWSKEFYQSDGATLGKGSGYLRSLWDIKERMVLKPLRRKILYQFVYPLVNIYADWMGDKKVLDYEFGFNSSMPVSMIGDMDPEKFITVGEAREMSGLEQREEKSNLFISEIGKSGGKDV